MRASALRNLGAWYHDLFPMTDWPLYIVCADDGEIRFADEVVGAYRLHDGGVVSALPGRAKLDMIARFYRGMDEVLPAPSNDRVRAGASRFFFDWAEVYADT